MTTAAAPESTGNELPAARRRVLGAWCLFFTLVIGITALDLWTKERVFEWLEVQSVGKPPEVLSQKRIVVVDGLFELEATYNRGAFSGWFREHTGALTALSAAAVLVIVGILAYSLRQPVRPSWWFVSALGAICAGTAGNLYDRYNLQAVRDWIKWFVVVGDRQWVWPNFNIADSAICVGVALLVVLEIARTRRHGKAPPPRAGGTQARDEKAIDAGGPSSGSAQGSAAASRRS